ncbi:O-antigen translocase [bacterium]|nr:O-antigen translocase [bacterium]
MNIKSTFFFTSIHTVIKILSGIIMNKIIAVYLGPSGLAMIGQFQNFVGIITGLSNASIQSGVVKYTAEYKEEKNALEIMMKNALLISIFFSFIISVFVYLFSNYLSLKIMFSSEYKNIFYFLSFSIIFYSLNLYVLSILNGLGEIKLFTLINILISIFTLIITSILTIFYKLEGALISIVAVQSIVFFISYYLVRRKHKKIFFSINELIKNKDNKILLNLFKFSLASFSGGVIASLMMISVRYLIESEISLSMAGIWEGGWRMMIYFNMFFVLPFSIYYLPKISASKKYAEIKSYLFEAYKFLIPLSLLMAFIIFYFKHEVVIGLFSIDFIEIENIILYLLIAEIIRILGNTISIVFLAKIKIYSIIFIELLFASSMLLSSYYFVDIYGIIGISYGYIIATSIFLTVYVYKFKMIKGKL